MSQMGNYKLKITNCKNFANIQMTISSQATCLQTVPTSNCLPW